MVQRKHLTETVIPMMYTCVKDDILTKMQSAERVAITCDTWTSLSTQSYMTVTSHYIDNEWCLMSHVLQTTEVLTSHTAINIADMLTGAIQEWGLTSKDPAVVTDNAANMVRAVEIMQLMHVGCFAHTLNLASQAGLKVPAVSRLLARVRRIATFFHRSTMANHILKEKQKLLQLPAHKLTVDVVTRWNSALDMLERFLEQQPAISATLLSQDVRRNETDLCTLTEEDVTIAEDLVRVLKPMKEATLAMSEDKQPTLSVIAPLLALLQEALTPIIEDSTVVRDLKAAAKNNLRTRYDAQKDILYAASAWILALRPYHSCLLKSKMTPSPDCRLRLPLLHVIKILMVMMLMKELRRWGKRLRPRSPRNPAPWSLFLGQSTYQQQRKMAIKLQP
ncbi:E3 SUMO-protein ligase ZBED1-like [Acanthopagrus latus]|uniref:E3 SUMO-protein ligase ZBED1-like n=1 Tax=Acanthopagrus latus TaxID=8177 RepID=UPI00187C228E|nr:E3 SUMO-protein ligase ZBED1-like [Acanthopagrus latus]